MGSQQIPNRAATTSDNFGDIFQKEMILVPANIDGNHWILMVAHMERHCIRVFDSLRQKRREAAELLLQYIKDEHMRRYQTPLDSDWRIRHKSESTPQQTNSSDCGVFTCIIGAQVMLGEDITFTQQHALNNMQPEHVSTSDIRSVMVLSLKTTTRQSEMYQKLWMNQMRQS